MTITTLHDFLQWALHSFEESEIHFGHGTDNAWDEAVAIARFVLNLPPDATQEVLDRILSDEEKNKLESIAMTRIVERIPVPYLIHEAWFAGLKFYVDERVLIPRSPLGELILKKFKPWIKSGQPIRRILDLCSGSGCIAIACAYAFPDAIIDAVEISEPAIEVAEMNIKMHKLQDRINLLKSDLFTACVGEQYDIIVSNPPYVSGEEFAELPPEFQWEPKIAMTPSLDGLSIVRQILRQAPIYLAEQGILIVEVGNSSELLISDYPTLPFTWIEFEHGGEGVFLLNEEDKEFWQIS